jgi:hypothetical protein
LNAGRRRAVDAILPANLPDQGALCFSLLGGCETVFMLHHNCSYTFALWSWCWAKDGVIAFHSCIPINPQHPQKSPDTRNRVGCVCWAICRISFLGEKVESDRPCTCACVFCTVRVPCGERNFNAREGLQRLSMPAARRPQV